MDRKSHSAFHRSAFVDALFTLPYRENLCLLCQSTSKPNAPLHAQSCKVIKKCLNVCCLCRWEGKNENEVGRCRETGKIHVTVNHKYYRPTEVVSKGILTALPRNAPVILSPDCCIWAAVCRRALIA